MWGNEALDACNHITLSTVGVRKGSTWCMWPPYIVNSWCEERKHWMHVTTLHCQQLVWGKEAHDACDHLTLSTVGVRKGSTWCMWPPYIVNSWCEERKHLMHVTTLHCQQLVWGDEALDACNHITLSTVGVRKGSTWCMWPPYILNNRTSQPQHTFYNLPDFLFCLVILE